MKESYESDIILGESYRDKNTGLEGIATALYFFQHSCERVQLDYVHEGDLKQVAFDALQLIHLGSGKPATSDKTGGPTREHQVRPGAVR